MSEWSRWNDAHVKLLQKRNKLQREKPMWGEVPPRLQARIDKNAREISEHEKTRPDSHVSFVHGQRREWR